MILGIGYNAFTTDIYTKCIEEENPGENLLGTSITNLGNTLVHEYETGKPIIKGAADQEYDKCITMWSMKDILNDSSQNYRLQYLQNIAWHKTATSQGDIDET